VGLQRFATHLHLEQTTQADGQPRYVDARILTIGEHHDIGGKCVGKRVHVSLEIWRTDLLFTFEHELDVDGQRRRRLQVRVERGQVRYPPSHVVGGATRVKPPVTYDWIVRRVRPMLAFDRLQI